MSDDQGRMKMEELERYVQEVDRQNKRLISSCDDLKASLNRRFRELGQLTRLLEEKERELAARERDVLLYQKRLEKIKGTLSWKITAPLRKFEFPFFDGAQNKELKRRRRIIAKSGLFDAEWYLQEYPDVAESGQDPILHYLIFGAKEGRRPSASFVAVPNPPEASGGAEDNPLLVSIATNKKSN
ncbi:hypothetical protein NUV25_20575 [Burkholderia pseudomultivorans]|uniref:hypothetical protein n=1 Tax=Burkholderia pseudomultivorans TaxID=1207504 RepID=UPI0028760B1E|nr:hypothetical protein [Burkholderia pseudomultivorans]MDS0860105.1 hypothetical protein [Burkholderia pseudomultivorans]